MISIFKTIKNDQDPFKKDLEDIYKSQQKTHKRFTLLNEDLHPILDEKTTQTGFDRHYIYHTAWAARILQ